MSSHYLTHTFDIHGGGMDLIFPHHENEIAQSCAACPDSKVNYWMHNGFVTANDEKMSKSVGNFFTIREVTKLYHPLALRYFLMGTHYRSPVNYAISQIEIASESVFYIYQTLQDCKEATSKMQNGVDTSGGNKAGHLCSTDAKKCIENLRNEFESRLSDDLHTPSILNAALQEVLRVMNGGSLNTLKKQKKQQQQQLLYDDIMDLEKEVRTVLDVLGLLSSLSYCEVLQQFKEKALKRAELTEDDILESIGDRAKAREEKDYSKSDQIRKDLALKGIALMDVGNNETIWRPCVRLEESSAQPAATIPTREKASVQPQQD
ncbi:unnamed protein product [Cuscuta epithymum]|uniref:tRNA synthetases class I catalytic domain-containing protein n=1 Tax=Cuscuta epithymum TaxID=186058 RepID=A0AAV0FJH7_9ASTE|nr:unnamed protein product [Cuscuta epithymum]CAH9135467.1 unnamed protein product [Cuscuta epithymum]